MTVGTDEIVAVVERFHRDMGKLSPDEATSLFTEDGYIQMMMKEPYAGRAEIHRMFTLWTSHYTDVVTTPQTVTASGNRVAVEWLDTSDHNDMH
ncbi:nuclear transport factor 2 family protein, partial [Streptomyces cuspidosporus]